MFLAERGDASARAGSATALGGVAQLAGPNALTFTGGGRALADATPVPAGMLASGAYTIVSRPLGSMREDEQSAARAYPPALGG